MARLLPALSALLLTSSFLTAHADGAATLKKDTVTPSSYNVIDHLTGNFTLTSNYVFRGISQTDDLPAVQGSFNYSLPFGFYLNVWGSNVRFQEIPDASVEIDTIAGIKGEFDQDTDYDVSVSRYNYPRARFLNYNELIGLFTYKIITLTMTYSGNINNTHETGLYYNGAVHYDVPSRYALNLENISVGAGVGHASLPRAAGNSYNDYVAFICKTFKQYTLMLRWTGTDHRQNISPLDDNHVIASLAADF